MMVTSTQCENKYGDPNLKRAMTLWLVPTHLVKGKLPAKVYCNRDMVKPLEQAFENIVKRGLVDQVESWDGCFNIRPKRGLKSMSLHSWGIAVDINAATNGLGAKPTMSPELVACFTDAGFHWGGVWSRPDGMHFQLAKI